MWLNRLKMSHPSSHGLSVKQLGLCARHFIHKCAMPMIISNHKGVIQWVNTEAGRRFRYDPALLVGRHIETLMPKIVADKHAGFVKRFLDTAVPHIEGGPPRLVPVIDGNGRTHLLGLSVTAIRPAGHAPFFIAVFVDNISAELVSLHLCQLVVTTVREHPSLAAALLPIMDAFRDCLSIPKRPGAPITREFEEARMVSLVDMTKQALLSHPDLHFSDPNQDGTLLPFIVLRTDDAWRMLKSILAILELFSRAATENEGVEEADPIVITVRQEDTTSAPSTVSSISVAEAAPHQLVAASVPMSDPAAVLLSLDTDISQEFLVHEAPPQPPVMLSLEPHEPLGLCSGMFVDPVDESRLPTSFLQLLARFHHAHADTGVCLLRPREAAAATHCLVWLRLYTPTQRMPEGATTTTLSSDAVDIPAVYGAGAV